MNILQMISGSGLHGAERMIVELSTAMNLRGHRAIVADLSDVRLPNKQLSAAAAAAGVDEMHVACNGRLDFGSVSRIRDVIREHNIDLVHTHGYKADIYASLANRSLGKPLVATCHNWIATNLKGKAYEAIDRIVLRHFEANVAVSTELAGVMVSGGIDRARVRVIQNGIDPAKFVSAQPSLSLPFAPGTIVAGFVGRLSPEKNCDLLLRTLARVTSAEVKIGAVLVGTGPSETQLRQMADELGVCDKVYFAGRRDDMPGVYASMDFLILPSSTEGFPLVVIEAMSAGKPVVASKVGEIPSIIEDGDSGLLVSPGDIDELVHGVSLLAGDAMLRQRLGIKAQQRALKHFTAAHMATNYEALYLEVLSRVNARHAI